MNTQHSTVTAIYASLTGRRILVGTLGALLFASLTWLGANIRIPLQPVPITLQTLFVLLTGAILGVRFGALAQFFYVGLGAAGLPIFAGATMGFVIIAGPTGGYLLGFLIAPLMVGHLIRKHDSIAWQILVFWLGSLTILSLGVAHLTVFYTHDIMQSVKVGYFPFLIGDALKIVAAVSIYRSFHALRAARDGA